MTVTIENAVKEAAGGQEPQNLSQAQIDKAVAFGFSTADLYAGMTPATTNPWYSAFEFCATLFAVSFARGGFNATRATRETEFEQAKTLGGKIFSRLKAAGLIEAEVLVENGEFETYPLNPTGVITYGARTRFGTNQINADDLSSLR